jgi:hypothetical protein
MPEVSMAAASTVAVGTEVVGMEAVGTEDRRTGVELRDWSSVPVNTLPRGWDSSIAGNSRLLSEVRRFVNALTPEKRKPLSRRAKFNSSWPINF